MNPVKIINLKRQMRYSFADKFTKMIDMFLVLFFIVFAGILFLFLQWFLRQ